jgi:hypothetical protein
MAALTISMPDDVYQKLQQRAQTLRREPAAVVIEILENELCAAPDEEPPKLTPEEKLKAFTEWVQSRPKIDVVLDDSRESFYEGRGE